MNINRKILLPALAILYAFTCPAYSGNTSSKKMESGDQEVRTTTVTRRSLTGPKRILAEALPGLSLDLIKLILSYVQHTDIPTFLRTLSTGLTHLDLSWRNLDWRDLEAIEKMHGAAERRGRVPDHSPLRTLQVLRFDDNSLETAYDFLRVAPTGGLGSSPLRVVNLARNPMGDIGSIISLMCQLETRYPGLVSLDLSSTYRNKRTGFFPGGMKPSGNLQELYFHGNPCSKDNLDYLFQRLRAESHIFNPAGGCVRQYKPSAKYMLLSLSVQNFEEASPSIAKQLPPVVAVLIMPDSTRAQCRGLEEGIRDHRDSYWAPKFPSRELPITVRNTLPRVSQETGMPDGLFLLPEPTVKRDRSDEKEDR